MTLSVIRRWLAGKWRPQDRRELLKAYQAVFTSSPGQQVLQHLVDNIYCTVYIGNDPIASALHEGRRSVVHEILENIDLADYPNKYVVKTNEEIPNYG